MKLLVIVIMLAFTAFTACIAEETQIVPLDKYKESIKLTIGQVLEDPETFDGKSVEISGKLTTQCGSGCWFIMSDETGDLYVTLRPNNFVIHPAMGKELTVNGTVVFKNNDVSLVGKSVVVEGKTYS